MVNLRPSTKRRLREEQLKRISPLHVSIARLSYLRDHAQQIEQEKDTEDITQWAKQHIKKKGDMNNNAT